MSRAVKACTAGIGTITNFWDAGKLTQLISFDLSTQETWTIRHWHTWTVSKTINLSTVSGGKSSSWCQIWRWNNVHVPALIVINCRINDFSKQVCEGPDSHWSYQHPDTPSQIGSEKVRWQQGEGLGMDWGPYTSWTEALNSLPAMDAHEHPLFIELCGTVVSCRIFIRSQSLIARWTRNDLILAAVTCDLYEAYRIDDVSRGSKLYLFWDS